MLVGYVRVSTTDDRQTTDLQRDALRAAGVDERNIHEDRASGSRDDRPGLKTCIEYLRPGDVLVVWKLDRLGRSLRHLIEIVTGLRERGIGFRSTTEAIDTTTPMGEFMFHLFGALAQYERSLIRERVIAGLEAAKRRGRMGGRPRKLGVEQVETARALLVEGKSMSSAARAVGVPRSTLVDSLRRAQINESLGDDASRQAVSVQTVLTQDASLEAASIETASMEVASVNTASMRADDAFDDVTPPKIDKATARRKSTTQAA